MKEKIACLSYKDRIWKWGVRGTKTEYFAGETAAVTVEGGHIARKYSILSAIFRRLRKSRLTK